MKIIRFTGLILGCAGFIFCVNLHAQDKPSAYSGSEEMLHVYLLIGQSNMAGRAPFSAAEAGVIERGYLLNDKDEWEPARNPLKLELQAKQKVED